MDYTNAGQIGNSFTVPTGGSPFYLAITGDGQTVYASDASSGSVFVSDAATLGFQAVPFGPGDPPYQRGIALNAAGTKLFVGYYGDPGIVTGGTP